MTAADVTPTLDVEVDDVDVEFTEPDDVDACTLCKGSGYYTPAYSILAPRGELTVTCPSCAGSGEYQGPGRGWVS